jgi:DNA mismatch endonuclease (patch repair protein)
MSNKKDYIRDGRSPIPDNESTSKIMSAIKDRNTNPELFLRKELWKNGIRGYRVNWKKLPGKPDIAFPGKKIAVFINGCFWHRCPYCNPPLPKSHSKFWANKFEKNIERDKKIINQLKTIDWESIVIWECQIKNDVKNCVERITEGLTNM